MSADWVLHALPNTPETRKKVEFLEGSDGTFYSSQWVDDKAPDPEDEPEYELGEDGYWRWRAMPMEKLLDSATWHQVRDELKLDSGNYVWLGQVSYLKAGLFYGDPGEPNWIPEPGQAVAQIAARLPEITPTLITSIMVAMNVKDTSWFRPGQFYSDGKGGVRRHGGTNKIWVGMARPRRIKRWLEKHKGELLYVEVW